MNPTAGYLDVPYEERWERLKPAIVKIYIEERSTLSRLAQRMVEDFSFRAEYVAPHAQADLCTLRENNLNCWPSLTTKLYCRVRVSHESARVHQYRYQFKKWGIKKRTTTVEKEAVITALGKRGRQHGMGTSNVNIEQGGLVKPVDKKQLKRHLNDSIRREIPSSLRPGM